MVIIDAEVSLVSACIPFAFKWYLRHKKVEINCFWVKFTLLFSYFAMIFFYLLNLLQNSWQNKISILYEYIAHNNRKLNCLSIAVMTLYSSLVFIMAKFLLNIHKGRSSQQWRTWAKVEDYFLTSREAACVTDQMLHRTKNDF